MNIERYYLNRMFRVENTLYSIDHVESFTGTNGKLIKESYSINKADVADDLVWETVSQYETKESAIENLKKILEE